MVDSTELTIVSLNCLNPKYALDDRYYVHECDFSDLNPNDCHINHYLPWNYRKEKLTEFIVNLNPDIICLQEVNYEMACHICKAVTGELFLSFRKSDKSDGCAIIWTTKKIKPTTKFWRGEMFYYKYSNEHIIQICELQLLNNKEITIMNTHVNWLTRNEDIKETLYPLFEKELKKQLTLLIGDFNAEINEDWFSLFDKNPLFFDVFENNRPLFTFISSTKNKPLEKKTIDHCFISGLSNKNIEIKPFCLSTNSYPKYLPNSQFPSDHLPLVICVKIE